MKIELSQLIDEGHRFLTSELHGGLFDGIDTGPIYIRLAGLAQTAVTHGDAKVISEKDITIHNQTG